jgi:hypothetical protein
MIIEIFNTTNIDHVVNRTTRLLIEEMILTSMPIG